ncbi:hypothetical protein QR680_014720 [Steinernema hermaphroditum]|uniref:Pericentriolar material 1 protein C-terminal domain-containing protein n=1 Tax=Steinernema hermaphroditum TaxID=289476 RepID=A0AA39M3Q0_9BILA|nr:hypothetical protein QR680_014720 [Steinernema hermaphroditum]
MNECYVANEDTVKERLAFFSKKKAALLSVLRQMRDKAEKENNGQFTDAEKEMMAKCLSHYEILSEMEEKYIDTMNSIVGIRKNATEDFEAEQKDLRQTLNESIVQAAAKGAEKSEDKKVEEEGKDEDSDSEDALELLQKEMAEMVRLSEAVAKGQQINEQLSKRFQLLKEKRHLMKATREQKTAAQVKEELAAAGQYRSTRNRLSNESGQLDRKQKTLERLRKKVIERGMLAGAEASPQKEDVTKEVDLETSGLRVPVLAADDSQEESEAGEEKEDDSDGAERKSKPKSRLQRHKELKEKEAKEREEAEKREALIRESFARLAARRDRMSVIRSQLETLSQTPEVQTEMKADSIKTKLSELSKMREHLEKLQQSGSDFQDEEEFAQQLASLEASSEEVSVSAAEANGDEAADEEEDEDEVVVEVRRHFENGMSSSSSSCPVDDRLRSIEQSLHRHQAKLNEIASQLQNTPPRCCQHCRYQPLTSASAALRHALLNATITQLQYFNDAVTRLTEGRSVAHLDQAINALFNAADPCLLRQDTITQDDTQSLCTSVALSHTHSASPDYDPSRKVSCESQSRAEEAKRQLSSGRAKLEKQRTLERIRTFTAKDEQQLSPNRLSVSPRVSPKSTATTSPLERDICLIMEAVLPWIKEHEADDVDETLISNLSAVVLRRATNVALPGENRGAADRFDVQLSTILNSTLPQYEGAGLLGELRDQIVFEITDILYNELAFVQMMQTVDDVVIGLRTTVEV